MGGDSIQRFSICLNTAVFIDTGANGPTKITGLSSRWVKVILFYRIISLFFPSPFVLKEKREDKMSCMLVKGSELSDNQD
jgi:hypothetical protein